MDEVTTETSKTTTSTDEIAKESKTRWQRMRAVPLSQRIIAEVVIALILFVFVSAAALVSLRQNDMEALKEVGTFPVVILLVGGFLTLLGVKDPE